MTATVTHLVRSTNTSLAAVEGRAVAVSLPRLRCLEGAAPTEQHDRPIWRGPPRMAEAPSLPPGSRVSPLSAAIRAACLARQEPVQPVAPPPAVEPPPSADSPLATLAMERNARMTVAEFRASRRALAARDVVAYVAGCAPANLAAGMTGSPNARWRQVVYWLLTDVLRLSTPRAGALMGRDHSTVIHGRDRVRAAIAAAGVSFDDATTLAALVEAVLAAMEVR